MSAAESDTAIGRVREIFEAATEGGAEILLTRFDDFFAEAFEWTPALVGGLEGERTYTGRAGFAEYWRDFGAAFDQFELSDVVVEERAPGRFLVLGMVHARGAGSGVPIKREAVYVLDVEAGRIVRGRSFLSRADSEEFLAVA